MPKFDHFFNTKIIKKIHFFFKNNEKLIQKITLFFTFFIKNINKLIQKITLFNTKIIKKITKNPLFFTFFQNIYFIIFTKIIPNNFNFLIKFAIIYKKSQIFVLILYKNNKLIKNIPKLLIFN